MEAGERRKAHGNIDVFAGFLSDSIQKMCPFGRMTSAQFFSWPTPFCRKDTPDPGHKAEVTIDGIQFSCHKGFTIQTVSGYLTARLIQHDKGMAGVFVILPGKNIVSAQRPLYDHISEIASNKGVKKGQAYE